MKKEIPIFLGVCFGFLWFLEFFFSGVFFITYKDMFMMGFRIAGAAGVLVAIYSVARLNYMKIKYNNERWWAVYTVALIIMTVFLGLYRGDQPGTPFDSLFVNVYAPGQSTVFSLLAFYIASAAFRAFRMKSLESTLLLITSIVVMLSRIPLGDIIPGISTFGEWLLDGPSSAGRRAILFGTYLGQLTMFLRIMFGLERSHISE